MSPPANALTIDVEDYFQVEAFAGRIPRDSWETRPLRVVESTTRLLDLLERRGVRATFFVLGWVAQRVPKLVAEIVRRGHEVGCHSFWHRLVYSLEPAAFREDLRMATRAIEDASGTRPRGYRAPSFSITRKSLWALRILAEEGYAYDSSIFPIRHDVYGFPGFPRFPVRVAWTGGDGKDGKASIAEFPPSTVRWAGLSLPAPGGGYLRIFPLRYSFWALRRIARCDGLPATVYLHPWEIDPGQPRLDGPLKSRLRHYTGLARMEAKLDRLLGAFPFAPMSEVLEAHPPLGEYALGVDPP